MKNRPIILVNDGCSMSSFTISTIYDLIKKHGYDINKLDKTELYNPEKNLYYIDGMDIVDLLKKTFDEVPNICMKLSTEVLRNEKLILFLKQQNPRMCFIDRENLLDIAVCTLKDFTTPPQNKELFDNFGKWRNSAERLKTRVGSSRILKTMKKFEKVRFKKRRIMKRVNDNQKKFISAEKLCSFDVNEYARVFEILGFHVEYSILNEYFSGMEVREPYKHKDVIRKEDIDELKENLKKHNFLKYWRWR